MQKRPLPLGVKFYSETATKVFDGIRFDVYQWEQEQFDGSTRTFETVRRADNVFVLPVVNDDIVVVREQQPHWDELRLNTVTGLVEDGEDILDAARRELEEETGMIFENFYLVHMEQPNPSAEWISYTFIATGFKGEEKDKHLDFGERNEILRISIDEYIDTVRHFGLMYRQRFAEDYLIQDKQDVLKNILINPEKSAIKY